MIPRIKLLILIPVVMAGTLSAREIKPRMAIMPFTGQEVGPADPALFHNVIRDYFVHSRDWIVVERVELHKVLDEQRLSGSGLLDSDTQIATGRLLNVDKLLVGIDAKKSYSQAFGMETQEEAEAFKARNGGYYIKMPYYGFVVSLRY